MLLETHALGAESRSVNIGDIIGDHLLPQPCGIERQFHQFRIRPTDILQHDCPLLNDQLAIKSTGGLDGLEYGNYVASGQADAAQRR